MLIDFIKDINQKFSERLDAAKTQKMALLDNKHRLLKNQTHLKPWVEDFKKYQNIEKLERSIAVALIDSIIISFCASFCKPIS